MGQRGHDRDVGAGLQRQMVAPPRHAASCTRSMRRGSMTISLAPWRSRFFRREANTGCAVGRVGADDHDDVGVLDRVEILRAGRGAEGLAEAVAGRRMADAGAGVDIVVAEAGADQLLDEIGLLVGAARRGDAADRVLAVLVLDAAELAWRRGRWPRPSDTSRHGSVIFSRIIGLRMRSLWVA